jgi:ABC-type antimicrobial peptide transport system permease subunit
VWDNGINRVMDVFFSIPGLLLAVGIAAMRGPGVNSAVVAIVIVYTPLFVRIMRGPVLAQLFIEEIRSRAESVGIDIALSADGWVLEASVSRPI